MKTTTSVYEEQYGQEYVGMDKETAIYIIHNFSEYEHKEKVEDKIRRSDKPPFLRVPPMAFLLYKETLKTQKEA